MFRRFPRSPALAVILAAGCASGGPKMLPGPVELPPVPVPAAVAPDPIPRPQTADGFLALVGGAGGAPAVPKATPVVGPAELTPDALVRAVLERNPTLDQMTAAAAAAAARYPQVTSLDDPMLSYWTAPGSIGSPNVDFANRVEFGQKFLTAGKRGLKGQAALAEAAAATKDIDDARLQLVEGALAALADYALAEKLAGIVEENRKLLTEFKRNAQTRYTNLQAPQQDVLQADLELARVGERLAAVRRAKRVAVARLNTLMHLPPDSPLPPPANPPPAAPLPDPAELRARAVANRPDLKAVADRLAAEQAAVALALKEYTPDVELVGAYDGFWQGTDRPLQWQLGARVNLPVRRARRAAAVAEAQARLAQRRAELVRLTDQANLQVQEAFEQARESDEVAAIFRTTVLPAAEANVREAQTAYVNGRVPFVALVEAQRNRIGLRERYAEVIAESARRRAALDRAAGGG